jgi:transposase
LLDAIFAGLGLDQLFASIKHSAGITYDLQGIVRLLTYGRILEPASKIATMRQNDSYYRPLVKSDNDFNVYDVLDVIYENRKQIIRRMNTCISRGIGRNTSTVFYDVTNFFFETEEPDEDLVDEEGQDIEKGLRKMGVSKENRKQPIIQMGLFLDDNGIPISIETFPGNTLDHLTLRTAMKNTVDTLDLDRFILIADRGMYSGTNMCHVIDRGNGYIVSKSLKKSASQKTHQEIYGIEEIRSLMN